MFMGKRIIKYIFIGISLVLVLVLMGVFLLLILLSDDAFTYFTERFLLILLNT